MSQTIIPKLDAFIPNFTCNGPKNYGSLYLFRRNWSIPTLHYQASLCKLEQISSRVEFMQFSWQSMYDGEIAKR